MDECSELLRIQFERESVSAFVGPLEKVISDEAIALSDDFDASKIQQSWSWRNVYVARELAKRITDPQGHIDPSLLIKAIELLEKNLYSLGPGRENDGRRQRHLLSTLKLFRGRNEYTNALKRISRPFSHPVAEHLIRETLDIPIATPLTDGHARQATLAALFTYLRQNVGSCFATAPAILIQQDQPLQLLADIGQLLGTGRLSRVFEGKEYIVPLSISWGMGELLRPISLSALNNELIARSPGLQAAFEAVGLIESHLPQQEKKKRCLALLNESETKGENGAFAMTTANDILREVLLKKFGVTAAEVVHFRQQSWQGSPLAPPSFARGGKALAAGQYLKAYETAKSRFKILTDNALLKAWEFTLASLSESKADFAKWNLYSSLGVHPEEESGIGQSLYKKIREYVELINREIAECQSRYDHLFAQAKYLEGRAARVSSESEMRWVQADYQMRRHEINRVVSERDAAYDKGRRLQGLYSVLIDFYGEQIPHYFQEVYDAEMHDVSANPYDDSPAGFRLMYKHGRSNTALWTMIDSPAEYIQHLISFFVSTENELQQREEFKGVGKELSDMVTTLIMTIKRPEFLESSFARLAKAYQEPAIRAPLQKLEKVRRKPWSYISGGNMGTLVSCYWGRVAKPKEAKRWIEDENEYLAFLIDTVKELPLTTQRLYQGEGERNMLAFSPTHAFNCKPGWELFKKAWESDIYTYTWIRDFWVAPQLKFLDALILDHRMMEKIIQHMLQFLPEGYRPIVAGLLRHFTHAMTPTEFRSYIGKTLSYEKWLLPYLEPILEEVDSLLYQFLPFFPEHRLTDHLSHLFEAIDLLDRQLITTLHELYPKVEDHVGKYKMLTAQDLRDTAKALLIAALKQTRTSIDYHREIVSAMQKNGLGYPEPFLFADTNWVKNVFGFTINPGTRKLEFWRFDSYGGEGRPIGVWKPYLNGTQRLDWGLYTQPREWGQI